MDGKTGTFESELPDGSKIVISPEKGFYNKFGEIVKGNIII